MVLTIDQLDKITYKLPPVWKIPFYEFVGGKLTLIELEKIIYEQSNLESIIGEDTYIDLISFNFSDTHNYGDLIKFILDKVLFEENDRDCKLFVLIGEFYKVDVRSKIENSKNLPEAVLGIFKDAHIESNWRRLDNPACDVKFFNEVEHLKRPVKGCMDVLPSSAVIIGYACNSDIILFMDDDGVVYYFLQIIDVLYRGGNFLDAMIKLFFGLEYGELLCTNAGAGL